MPSQAWMNSDKTELAAMPVPLRPRIAYLNYACLPRAP